MRKSFVLLVLVVLAFAAGCQKKDAGVTLVGPDGEKATVTVTK